MGNPASVIRKRTEKRRKRYEDRLGPGAYLPKEQREQLNAELEKMEAEAKKFAEKRKAEKTKAAAEKKAKAKAAPAKEEKPKDEKGEKKEKK